VVPPPLVYTVTSSNTTTCHEVTRPAKYITTTAALAQATPQNGSASHFVYGDLSIHDPQTNERAMRCSVPQWAQETAGSYRAFQVILPICAQCCPSRAQRLLRAVKAASTFCFL